MSASAELVCVHPSQLREVWPLVEERLRSAVQRTDLNHPADIERQLFEGDGVLWVAIYDGAIVAAAITYLARTDRHLVCNIAALGGAKRETWMPLLSKIEAWARAEGAALVRVMGREGWARVLKDYHRSNVVLEKTLA